MCQLERKFRALGEVVNMYFLEQHKPQPRLARKYIDYPLAGNELAMR